MMNIHFLYPDFLWGLLFIAVPIIVHLFNFRKYKVVYFSNIDLLKEVQTETKSKSRLKHLLVLLSRILIITALVLAFAQPVQQENTNINKDGSVGVLIDNSFSSNNIYEEGRILDNLKRTASNIAEAYPSTQAFKCITQDEAAEESHEMQVELLGEYLVGVSESAQSNSLNDLLLKQKIRNEEGGQPLQSVFVLSDFQKSNWELNTAFLDTNTQYYLMPFTPSIQSNISIDSIAMPTIIGNINEPVIIKAFLTNHSKQEFKDLSVKLLIDGKQKSIATVSFTEMSSEEVEISFTPKNYGAYEALLTIEDYPINFDNDFYFVFEIESKVNVLILNDGKSSQPFYRLFKDPAMYEVVSENYLKADYSSLSKYHLIILNELSDFNEGLNRELSDFVRGGGDLVFIPSKEMDVQLFNLVSARLGGPSYGAIDTSLLSMESINEEHPFFKGVFEKMKSNEKLILPRFSEGFVTNQKEGIDPLLFARNGQSILSLNNRQNTYWFSAPLNRENSDFYNHGLFVPVFLKMAMNAKTQNIPYYFASPSLQVKTSKLPIALDYNIWVREEGKSEKYTPFSKGSGGQWMIEIPQEIQKGGWFNIGYQDSSIFNIAINYSRKESVQEYYSREELQDWIDKEGLTNVQLLDNNEQSAINEINRITKGKSYWLKLVVLALIFLLVESLLLRSWRKKSVL